MQALEKEIETYNAKLPELLSHVGKFVLIREETVEGFFDTYTDALRAGYERPRQSLLAARKRGFHFGR